MWIKSFSVLRRPSSAISFSSYSFSPGRNPVYSILISTSGLKPDIRIRFLARVSIFTGLPIEGEERLTPTEKIKDAFYVNIPPADRKTFWEALENPYGLLVRHEYIFMLLHGLERHLLAGNCLPAARCIIELRKFIGDREFRNTTANGLMMTAMICNRPEIAEEFLATLHPYYYFDFSGDLYVMMMYALDVPMTPERLMILYKNFGYKKFRSVHIRNLRQFGDIYLLELQKAFDEKFGSQEIRMKDFITREEYLNLPRTSVPVYTSVAISDHEIEVPCMMDAGVFRDFTKLIEETDDRAQKTRIAMYKKFELTDEARKVVKYLDYH